LHICSNVWMTVCELAHSFAGGKIVVMRARESAAEYVVKNGKRKAVILPIEEYEELLEDLYDLGVIASRRHEPTIPFEDVLRRLKKNASA
jgi:prevent-host-death family protein